jgi:hypothetical protein
LKDGVFVKYLVQPTSFAEDWKRTNFTDGSYTISFEDGRKVFYPAPLIPGIAS